MKARDIIGKKVKSVQQNRFWNDHLGCWSTDLVGIVFTDGSTLSFHTIETGSDYATGATFHKPDPGSEKS